MLRNDDEETSLEGMIVIMLIFNIVIIAFMVNMYKHLIKKSLSLKSSLLELVHSNVMNTPIACHDIKYAVSDD